MKIHTRCAISRVLLAFASVIAFAKADAATHCATTSAQLTTVLSIAASNPFHGEYDIRLVGGQPYDFPTLLNSIDVHGELRISGGWNSQCTARHADYPSATARSVVNAANDVSIGSRIDTFSTVVMEGVSFVSQHAFEMHASEKLELRDSTITSSSVHFVSGFASKSVIFEAQIVGNTFRTSDLELRLRSSEPESRIEFSHNTVAMSGCGFGVFNLPDSDATYLHHNVVRMPASCSQSLLFCDSCTGKANVGYNVFSAPHVFSGRVISIGPNNEVADVGLVNVAGGDFRLRESGPPSPAINAGLTKEQYLAQFGKWPKARDLDNGPRVVGGFLDLGAYESSIGPPETVVVTSTADQGAGTLREAVVQANGRSSPTTIKFALTGACPQRIRLSTPLPDVVESMSIEGYSQNGTQPNNSDKAFDGVLCVIVEPAAGASIAHGLHVPASAPADTQLAVTGIAFAGFDAGFAAAVLLEGGADHVLAGNIFGGNGTAPGFGVQTLEANAFDIVIGGSAERVRIGGSNAEDRNLFGATLGHAVNILAFSSGDEHVIENNYFGFGFPLFGTSAVRQIQGRAISALSASDVLIKNNVIVGAQTAIHLERASTSRYRIVGNAIGLDSTGTRNPAQFGNGRGIVVTGASAQHVIGGYPTDTSASGAENRIVDSVDDGIRFEDSAGFHSSVRFTTLDNNGRSPGVGVVGMGIDIGAEGVDPIDADDASDEGAFGLVRQNSPVILDAELNPDGSSDVRVQLQSRPGFLYRIDVFRSADCLIFNRRGNGDTHVGSGPIILGTTVTQGERVIQVAGTGSHGFFTATATRIHDDGGVKRGSTSEFSPCFAEGFITSAPTALADSFIAVEGDTLFVPAPGLLMNDTDPQNQLLGAKLAGTAVAQGQLVVPGNGASPFDGSFHYTPDPGHLGPDTFQYRAVDASGNESGLQTVTIQTLPAGIFADGFE